jgi:CO/xanthine dehydrogenase FAD-binding subunit
MLINLRTTHKPKTLDEAAALLARPGSYPIYGGGAYLLRSNALAQGLDSRDVHETVDLSRLLGEQSGLPASPLIDAAASLETIAASHPQFGAIIGASTPRTLRNALTLGDELMERRPDSLLMGLLTGFAANVIRHNAPPLPIGQWLEQSAELCRQTLIVGVALSAYTPEGQVTLAKVSRTPADSPIVAALAFQTAQTASQRPFVIIVGVDLKPVIYRDGLLSLIGDYKGSAEYRAAMAGVLSAQALAQLRN